MKFLVDIHGPRPETLMPDPVRSLMTSSWTTSHVTVDMWKSEAARELEAHKVGAAAYLARAHAFKSCLPMKRWFLELHCGHMRAMQQAGETRVTLSRDDRFRAGVADEDSVETMFDRVCLATHNPYLDETLAAHGMSVTDEELTMLEAWTCYDPCDDEVARGALPAAWRALLV